MTKNHFLTPQETTKIHIQIQTSILGRLQIDPRLLRSTKEALSQLQKKGPKIETDLPPLGKLNSLI